ncbi:MAG: hypothetical protein IKZ54_00545 [Bacteroidales bacterium]|nr:hypothetical protein [Bacteroidales bacterium]
MKMFSHNSGYFLVGKLLSKPCNFHYRDDNVSDGRNQSKGNERIKKNRPDYGIGIGKILKQRKCNESGQQDNDKEDHPFA